MTDEPDGQISPKAPDWSGLSRESILPLLVEEDHPHHEGTEPVLTPIGGGLAVSYGFHVPIAGTWIGINQSLLDGMELDREALHALALDNLGRLRPHLEEDGPVVFVQSQEVPGSSFLLRPDLWAGRAPDDPEAGPMAWVASPEVLVASRTGSQQLARTLGRAAHQLVLDGHIDALMSDRPWRAGDPPTPLDALPDVAPPEHGLPEEPVGLHLALVVLAVIATVGWCFGPWRALVVSVAGESGMWTTAGAALPYAVPAIVWGAADRIRSDATRAIVKLAAWAGMAVYALTAPVLGLTVVPGHTAWTTVVAAVIAMAIGLWYVVHYGRWVARQPR